MLQSRSTRLLAAALSLAVATAANARTSGDLHLRVGPGVNATFTSRGLSGACGDDAVCQFDVPADAVFEIVAEGRAKRDYRWTGCTSQPQPDRCRVEVRGQTVLVTVR
ncbi:MAG TPA: hypothetical protein VH392_01415 [Sphingomicrobium sp.]|jgi:hypothetical protein